MFLIKNIFSHIYRNASLYFFVFLVIFTIDRHHRYEISSNSEKYGPFELDVAEYYSFLPKFFYQNNDSVIANFQKKKRTIGMSIMYSPSFIVGHILAEYSGEKKNGYSEPYRWSIRWGSIIYCILGLLFCRKCLLLFFEDIIVNSFFFFVYVIFVYWRSCSYCINIFFKRYIL